MISRATLIGDKAGRRRRRGDVAALYDETHGAGFGVDAAGVGDEFYATVDRVFYVGGPGSDKRAESSLRTRSKTLSRTHCAKPGRHADRPETGTKT